MFKEVLPPRNACQFTTDEVQQFAVDSSKGTSIDSDTMSSLEIFEERSDGEDYLRIIMERLEAAENDPVRQSLVAEFKILAFRQN